MLSLLLACGSPDQGPSTLGDAPDQELVVDSAEDEVPPYVYEPDPEQSTPLLSTQDLADAVASGLDVQFSLDPRPFHTIYEQAVDHSDGDCPYVYEDYVEAYGYWYWYDTCTTTDGTRFAGNGRHYHYDAYVDGYYDYVYRNYYYGSAKIVTPEGNTLTAAGYASNYQFTYYNDYEYFYSYMYGDYRWDGPEAQGTWLEQDLSIVSYLYSNVSPDGGVWMNLDTSISGMEDELVTAIVFDGVVIYDELRSSPCPLEPSGTISVRDAEGDWYDIDFHGPDSGATAMFPPDCDGCGDAWFDGQHIGQVCPDFTPMLVWDGETPWR